jgi:transcriptional regulator with XRE-family HTH domain
MTDIGHAFAIAVRAARMRKGLTQLKLAEAAKISLDVIGALEREINVPTIETAAKLIQALGIDATEVFKSPPSTSSAARSDTEAKLMGLIERMDDCGAALLLELAASVAKVHPAPPKPDDTNSPK